MRTARNQLRPHRTDAYVPGGGRPALTGPAVATGADVPEPEKLTARGTR
ncbi:hypothetical protein [Streptomyces sp. CC224B]|nr:hypothetical protein [Streptomyces sp. CC224B]